MMPNINNMRYLFAIAEERHSENSNLAAALGAVKNFLFRQEKRSNNPGTRQIAFIGRSNVGKSTLINSLLEAEIAPKRNGPYTAAVVDYRYDKKFGVVIKYPGEPLASLKDCSSAREVLSFLEEKGTVSAEFAQAESTRITVYLPAPLLEKMVVYDTPGFGATDGKDENAGGLHDRLVDDFLEKTALFDSIFWMVRGDLRDDELSFITERKSRLTALSQMIVNVTGGEIDDEYRNGYWQQYGQLLNSLGLKKGDLLFVDARKKSDLTALRQSIMTPEEPSVAIRKLLERFIMTCRRDDWRLEWQPTTLSQVIADCERDQKLNDVVKRLADLQNNR